MICASIVSVGGGLLAVSQSATVHNSSCCICLQLSLTRTGVTYARVLQLELGEVKNKSGPVRKKSSRQI